MGFGWDGPFILAVDDTKVVSALRSYQDGTNWYLAGLHGVVHRFESYEELLRLSQSAREEDLAEKVC